MAMKGRGAPPLWISLRPRTTGIRPCIHRKEGNISHRSHFMIKEAMWWRISIEPNFHDSLTESVS